MSLNYVKINVEFFGKNPARSTNDKKTIFEKKPHDICI